MIDKTMLDYVNECRRIGLDDRQIARNLGMTYDRFCQIVTDLEEADKKWKAIEEKNKEFEKKAKTTKQEPVKISDEDIPGITYLPEEETKIEKDTSIMED